MRPRAFKSAGFAKQANKAGIADTLLCKAVDQILRGQADSLGGGVYKKRLNANQHRAIILSKLDQWVVFEFFVCQKRQIQFRPRRAEGVSLVGIGVCEAEYLAIESHDG